MPPRKKIKISTTNAAAAETTNKSNDDEVDISPSSDWRHSNCGSLLYLYPTNVPKSCKIAGFDVDDTVIKTKSGKTFAINDLTDWQLWSPESVKKEISKLALQDGYRIVFFTNQEGIGKGKVKENLWTKKIENVIAELGLNDQVTVLASLNRKENDFRKPHTGMWKFLSDRLTKSSDEKPDAGQSVYVGDAAGRPNRGSVKKDFSCTDYKFALNIGGGMTFHTPEQFFNKVEGDGASLTTSNMGFQPKVHWERFMNASFDYVEPVLADLIQSCRDRTQNEVIVIVGSPASGKSSITQYIVDQMKGSRTEYERINQDTLKTLKKCIDAAEAALSGGTSPIIDNTNRDAATRAKYITIAKKHNVTCRCIHLQTTKEESFHLNALRGATGNIHGEKRMVPDVVIHSFYKKLENPSIREGFEEVMEMDFIPGPFKSEEKKDAMFKFTH